jgi:hypothetical protein
MTKSKTKPKAKSKSSTKASAAKTAVTKSSAAPATSASPLIVLGYDEHQKPRGARFVDAKPDLIAKAADLMDLKGNYRRRGRRCQETAHRSALCQRPGNSCRIYDKTSTARSLLRWRSNPRQR